MPQTKLTLRPASATDRALFWQLIAQALRPSIEATWGWNTADQIARFDAAFDPAAYQVIELDGIAIGGLRIDAEATPVRLLNIQILPAFQCHGHGSTIIEHVITQAGSRAVWLQVLKVNPARRLYERLGFTITRASATHWHMLREPAGVIGSRSRSGALPTR